MCLKSSDQNSDPFAWPQTTLMCVNRRNQMHESGSSACAQIGEISLRYSHESQTYVIDGRMTTDEVTKSKARNTIRSHYRWVQQDMNNSEVDNDENFVDQSIQQARRRDVYLKWKHFRRKKLNKSAVVSTTDITVEQNNIPADSLHEDSSNKPTTSIMCDEETKTMAWLRLDNAINANEPISAQTSKDSYSEEFSTSSVPQPPLQEPQPQVVQVFFDESSLTDDSPTYVKTDISHYQRSDNQDFVRIQNIDTKGIIQMNERIKGRVTWWDDRCHRHKPFLHETDVSKVDDSASFDQMERGIMGLPSDAVITQEAEELSFDSNDNGSASSSSACSVPKCLTGEFWIDKSEKLIMQGCRVCKKVDGAIDKVKVMAVHLAECLDEVSCGMDEKDLSECIDSICPRILRTNSRDAKQGETTIQREAVDVPIKEVIIK